MIHYDVTYKMFYTNKFFIYVSYIFFLFQEKLKKIFLLDFEEVCIINPLSVCLELGYYCLCGNINTNMTL